MTRPWGVVWGVWGAGECGAGGVCSGSAVGERRGVVWGLFFGVFECCCVASVLGVRLVQCWFRLLCTWVFW